MCVKLQKNILYLNFIMFLILVFFLCSSNTTVLMNVFKMILNYNGNLLTGTLSYIYRKKKLFRDIKVEKFMFAIFVI